MGSTLGTCIDSWSLCATGIHTVFLHKTDCYIWWNRLILIASAERRSLFSDGNGITFILMMMSDGSLSGWEQLTVLSWLIGLLNHLNSVSFHWSSFSRLRTWYIHILRYHNAALTSQYTTLVAVLLGQTTTLPTFLRLPNEISVIWEIWEYSSFLARWLLSTIIIISLRKHDHIRIILIPRWLSHTRPWFRWVFIQLCCLMLIPSCFRTTNSTLQIRWHSLSVHHIIATIPIGVLLIPAFYTLHHILDVFIYVESCVLLGFSQI